MQCNTSSKDKFKYFTGNLWMPDNRDLGPVNCVTAFRIYLSIQTVACVLRTAKSQSCAEAEDSILHCCFLCGIEMILKEFLSPMMTGSEQAQIYNQPCTLLCDSSKITQSPIHCQEGSFQLMGRNTNVGCFFTEWKYNWMEMVRTHRETTITTTKPKTQQYFRGESDGKTKADSYITLHLGFQHILLTVTSAILSIL